MPKRIGPIEYKFTKGSWQSVETDENSNYIENRSYNCSRKADTVYVTIKAWAEEQTTATKNVHVIGEELYMPFFDRHKDIRIYLPQGYESSTERYPEIYIHDGQKLFDKSTAYFEEREVDETLNILSSQHGFNAMITGIDNGEDTRMDEYNSWKQAKYRGGDGDKYIHFIIDNLKPHIDRTLRTLPDQRNTCIMGSSVGGLIYYYAGLNYHDVFERLACSLLVSGSLTRFRSSQLKILA